jgi:hypothetical protein
LYRNEKFVRVACCDGADVIEFGYLIISSLSPLGQTLIPVIETTAKWGEAHREVLEPLLTNEQH